MNTLKKKYNHRKNKAVTPVLATLLMIAVAAAMSVTLFMWSKGFFV
jgi:flagellin-like protein|tara:strand:+ start:225 stop:362 length:138 start_codon:yes stop_codon:yes gene_type:complete